MAFGQPGSGQGPSNLQIPGKPAELKPEGGSNLFGKKHKKAHANYNARVVGGPPKSAALLGLKQAAQGPMAPGSSIMGPAGG
jgi:hypothetical protein